MSNDLLNKIEVFLTKQKMGASYFGKVSCGNSEVVARLRAGGRVWPETEIKIRAFILSRTKSASNPSEAA
jgi:hypothetical protein